MARTNNPPHAAPGAADTATDPAPAPGTPPGGDSPAAAVLAALSARPAGATVAGVATHSGISISAARQALLAHEKNGTATRIKGSRPGIANTWQPATTQAAPGGQAPPAGAGQPAPADSIAQGGEVHADPVQEPDPAVTAEAAGNVTALARAADQAGQALAAGNLDTALAALDTARDQAAQGRRVIKAAATGRRAPRPPVPARCATWSRTTCANSPRRPSPRTRSAKYSPGQPARSPTPWTSSPRWAPRS